MVLVEVRAEGVTGIGWTYATAGCRDVILGVLAPVIVGADPMDVPGITEGMIRASRNLGRPGLVGTAVSAADVALWDLKARLLDRPLSELFGRCLAEVPLYASGGFTTYDDATTRRQLELWSEELRIPRVKIKVGESWGAAVARDLHRVGLARATLGDEIELFVDANGGYSVKQAVRVGRAMADGWGVTWFEEPVSSDDLQGLAFVREHVPEDVAAGEYGFDEGYFARMLGARAVDCLQIDATRCGGFTGWLRAAATAGAHGVHVSAHCAPALHAHVALTVPNLRHVEYFHDHVRLEAMLFDGILAVSDAGTLLPDATRPGHGYELRERDALPFLVR